MHALVLRALGTLPAVEDLVLDPPGPGEVSVRILASGVCHSDLHVVDGDWGFDGPVVLGHEGAGVVEELGPGVEAPEPGTLVSLSWYYPCLRCRECASGTEWACTGTRANDHVQQDGTTRLHARDGTDVLAYLSIGTLAERAVVPAQAAVPIDPRTPPEVAALIGCCVATGVGAVTNTAGVRAGDSVAVLGLGGVGLSAVMGAAMAGAAPVIAVDRVPAKLRLAEEIGATETILAGDDDEGTVVAIRRAGGGVGPDHVIEAVGAPATVELAIRAVGMGGTVVLVGLGRDGDRASFDLNRVVERSVTVRGSNYGWTAAAKDFPRLAEAHLDGRLPIDRLVSERISLDDVNRAFEAMRIGEGARRVVVFDRPSGTLAS